MVKKFETPEWLHNTNIYEVNVRQYTDEGTFNGFARELPRLKSMGVDTLWFMPVTPISKKHQKGSLGSYYACSSYTMINPEFGTMADFKELIQTAHSMGFKVIIDWVANHTGWDHHWTVEHPEYYRKDPDTHDFKMASGMEDIIELDFTKPALRKAMIEAMQFWIDTCDIDGFRCDLAFWVVLDFWKEAREQLKTKRPLLWLGEFDELDHPDYGTVFDASYSWAWMHKTEEFYKANKPFSDLFDILMRYNDLKNPCTRAWFTSNHDENSWNGTEYEKYGQLAPALAVFSATWDGIPLIYSGQELPLKDMRIQFFDRDPIPWTGHCELEEFYSRLLHVHTHHPSLRAADPEVRTHLIKTSNSQVLSFLRRHGEREVFVLLNFNYSADFNLQVEDDQLTGKFTEIFTGREVDFSNQRNFGLEGCGYRVYEK